MRTGFFLLRTGAVTRKGQTVLRVKILRPCLLFSLNLWYKSSNSQVSMPYWYDVTLDFFKVVSGANNYCVSQESAGS